MCAPAFRESPADSTSDLQLESAIAVSRDSDWEYEYDENETEDYYFTLDVTTHQTGQFPKSKTSKTKVQRRNGRKEGAEPNKATAGPSTGRTTATPNKADAPPTNGVAPPTEDRRLRFLDVQTDNPLIMLEGQLYSCHWSTDRGSQFYVARPGVADAPVRSGRVLDIVGLSRARLVGRPAIARPRKRDTRTKIGASAENAITIDDNGNEEGEDEYVDTPMQHASISRQNFAMARRKAKDPEVKAVASFRERFSAVKERIHEQDNILRYGVKQYELPSNKDEIYERAKAEDAERERNGAPGTGRDQERGRKKRSSSMETITTAPRQQRRKPSPKSDIAISG